MFENDLKIKDLGFQVSVRKTFSVNTEKMWSFLLSELGIYTWLGQMNVDDFELQKPFVTADGIEGKLTVFKPDCHLRLRWKPKNWIKPSTVELRVTNSKGRASVVFHHTVFYEKTQIEELRTHWKNVTVKMNEELSK
jgi:activator of HSP90 ATPase